jgi:hypothetical protein
MSWTAASRAATSRATTAGRRRRARRAAGDVLARLHGRSPPRPGTRRARRGHARCCSAWCRHMTARLAAMHATRPPGPLWAPRAWIAGRWARGGAAASRPDGCWADHHPTPPRPAAPRAAGPVLPGLVDAHSHAFQRAFAGLAERLVTASTTTSGPGATACTAWRCASHPNCNCARWPAQLYGELLQGGYTQVCEFHYLHHDRTAAPMPTRWP